jgi:glucose/arabinose dehydrogenase/mono/diheme cytochrome c family protein
MHLLRARTLYSVLALAQSLAFSAVLVAQSKVPSAAVMPAAKASACANDDSGLVLPPGFCATVFADEVGHARHMAVSPANVVYVNTWSGRYYGNAKPPKGGFVVALQDKSGHGVADVVERFGETAQAGGRGGTGIYIYNGGLYVEINDRIVRYSLPSISLVPTEAPVTVVSGLPLTGDHPMHPFVIDAQGAMYVDVASATNACQTKNRIPKSPGDNPCTELETRAGIWLYDADKTSQKFSAADRYATGLRNGEGFAIDAAGRIFVSQHGRDQLYANWPEFYRPDQEATLPAEQFVLLKRGSDYGWPECYYDTFVEKLVLAPEYGGDGKKIGVCAEKVPPIAAFPAHWAPNGMVRYDKAQFPERYRNGVFVAFHGSWNRAPYPQGGYNVVFQPLSDGLASGPCEIFADGFAGAIKTPSGAAQRPSGLAVGPDGALYVSDDVRGRIYRVIYSGGPFDVSKITACPSLTAGAGEVVSANAGPPEGTRPNAGKTAALPKGATPEMIALGKRIYSGKLGGAPCSGCHGDAGQGSALGPVLNGKTWLWSDGGVGGIGKTITEGVAQPKNYRAPMPPFGGAQLTPDQVKALAAYVWTLSHK